MRQDANFAWSHSFAFIEFARACFPDFHERTNKQKNPRNFAQKPNSIPTRRIFFFGENCKEVSIMTKYNYYVVAKGNTLVGFPM